MNESVRRLDWSRVRVFSDHRPCLGPPRGAGTAVREPSSPEALTGPAVEQPNCRTVEQPERI